MRFIGVDSGLDRPRIQALRAEPPGLARDGGRRRRVFGAALEQWDALIVASGNVPPSASPILVFYALAQAGRALCAAAVSGQPWAPASHGLAVGDPTPDLGATLVSPDDRRDSAFRLFCRALGAQGLTAPTTLSRLWASHIHLDTSPSLGGNALRVIQLDGVSGEPMTRAHLRGEAARDLPRNTDAATATLRERLRDYPAARDLVVLDVPQPFASPAEPRVEIGWLLDHGAPRPVAKRAPGPVSGDAAGHTLYPALNDAGDVLPPLALWWATLLALSSIARYQPEAWHDALARDRSKSAIAIEQALEVSRELLPWMLLSALESVPAAPPRE